MLNKQTDKGGIYGTDPFGFGAYKRSIISRA
jgi:hypothetical protein